MAQGSWPSTRCQSREPSQDFLNGVCTHIIWLTQGRLTYYTGNYDTFQKMSATTRSSAEEVREEQADIKHLKVHRVVRYPPPQAAESKQVIDKMVAAGLTPPVVKERTFTFRFPDCAKVPPPVLPFDNVSFAYNGEETICTKTWISASPTPHRARRSQRRGQVHPAQAQDLRAHPNEGQRGPPPLARHRCSPALRRRARQGEDGASSSWTVPKP